MLGRFVKFLCTLPPSPLYCLYVDIDLILHACMFSDGFGPTWQRGRAALSTAREWVLWAVRLGQPAPGAPLGGAPAGAPAGAPGGAPGAPSASPGSAYRTAPTSCPPSPQHPSVVSTVLV
jgi:hypothetical protein